LSITANFYETPKVAPIANSLSFTVALASLSYLWPLAEHGSFKQLADLEGTFLTSITLITSEVLHLYFRFESDHVDNSGYSWRNSTNNSLLLSLLLKTLRQVLDDSSISMENHGNNIEHPPSIARYWELPILFIKN
jgi:hypothetical protein